MCPLPPLPVRLAGITSSGPLCHGHEVHTLGLFWQSGSARRSWWVVMGVLIGKIHNRLNKGFFSRVQQWHKWCFSVHSQTLPTLKPCYESTRMNTREVRQTIKRESHVVYVVRVYLIIFHRHACYLCWILPRKPATQQPVRYCY